MKRLFKNRMFTSVLLSVVLTFAFVFAIAYSATTISTNISTGNLTVTGTAGITGVTTMINASTTNITVAGNIWATGFVGIATTSPYAPLSVVGAGGIVADKFFATSTTAASTFIFASSTALTVTGTASTTNFFTTYASSSASTILGTASTTNLVVSSKIGVGTSTPRGEISAVTSATSTLYLHSSASNVGGCIELEGADGTTYAMYIAPADAASTTSNGRVGMIAIWEAGACK